MTHGEKLARAALEKWLKLYERQQACGHCKIVEHQCGTHKTKDDFDRIAKHTRKFLEGGPN